LRRKISKNSLKDFFEDYESFLNDLPEDKKGYSDVEKGCAYIQNHFLEAFNGNRLFNYVTCAIDTDNCKRVWKAIRDSVILTEFSKDFY